MHVTILDSFKENLLKICLLFDILLHVCSDCYSQKLFEFVTQTFHRWHLQSCIHSLLGQDKCIHTASYYWNVLHTWDIMNKAYNKILKILPLIVTNWESHFLVMADSISIKDLQVFTQYFTIWYDTLLSVPINIIERGLSVSLLKIFALDTAVVMPDTHTRLATKRACTTVRCLGR